MKKVLLVIIVLSIVGSCNSPEKTNHQITNTVTTDTTQIRQIYDKWLDIEGVYLDNIELVDIKGNKDSLFNIIKNRSVVLYYSECACENCVYAEFSYLLEYLKNSRSIEVIVLTASKNLRWLYSLMVRYDIQLRCFSTTYSNLGFDRYIHCGPMFFITDNNHQIDLSFEPSLHSKELTFKYLNKL